MRINLIAAVGTNGQLGLAGKLPWGADSEDLEWFRDTTRDGLVMVGYNTFESVKHINRTHGRVVALDSIFFTPEVVKKLAKDLQKECVWIAGGAKTYTKWMPHIDRFYISRIPYTGPADTWMPDITWSPSR